jgi:hypothetical protein
MATAISNCQKNVTSYQQGINTSNHVYKSHLLVNPNTNEIPSMHSNQVISKKYDINNLFKI